MAETTGRQSPDIQAGRGTDQGDFCPLPGSEFSEPARPGESQPVEQELTQQVSAVGEELRRRAGEGKEMAAGLFRDISHRLQDALAGQKDQALDKIDGIAAALRQAAGKLREEEDNRVASYANSAADRLEQLSRSLHEQNMRQMAGRFEDFARRRPEIVLGAAFLGGLLLGRVLRNPGSHPWDRMEPQHRVEESEFAVTGE